MQLFVKVLNCIPGMCPLAAGVAAAESRRAEAGGLSTAPAEVGAGGGPAPSLLLLGNARTLRRVERVVGGRRRLRRRGSGGGGGAVVVRGRVGDVEVVRLAIRRIRLGGPLPRRTLAQAVRPRFDVGAISCRSGPNSVDGVDSDSNSYILIQQLTCCCDRKPGLRRVPTAAAAVLLFCRRPPSLVSSCCPWSRAPSRRS